jgi:hypothetical protein
MAFGNVIFPAPVLLRETSTAVVTVYGRMKPASQPTGVAVYTVVELTKVESNKHKIASQFFCCSL